MTKPVKTLNIKGSAGDDNLVGGALGDTINGGKGNDVIEGRGGDDILIGGAGGDIFVFEGHLGLGVPASYGTDTIMDFNPDEGDKVSFIAGTHLTYLPTYDATWVGQQVVFAYDSALDRTTVSIYDTGNTSPLAQLHLSGVVEYSPDYFWGIAN